MDMSFLQAWGFLPFVVPICIYVAYSDMKGMIIPNKAVLALFAVFVVLGFFVMPTTGDYLWRYANFAVVLVIGMALNAARLLGAGDAKFMAAAAPMIALSDVGYIFLILAGCVIFGFVLHRIAKNSPIRQLAPEWKSWDSGRSFPMGFPLAMTLTAYLVWIGVQATGG